jgi:cell volume regulation protein A
MDNVTLFLVSIAAIFLIGALGEIIFQRTNIPDVVWLIVAGILIGPLLGLVSREQLGSIAPYFAALTLVVVLFEGGSTLKLSELSHAAPRSSVLALTGFLFSAVGVCVLTMLASFVGWLPDTWTWTHGALTGAILGGSSSIIIMPAMAQARLAPKIANLVNLESALTDAFCVVGTAALIDVMLGGGQGAAGPLATLARSFGIGLAVGTIAGFFWLLFLRFLHSSEHAYPVTLAALLILYVIINKLGGSAALGILTVAVILGNAANLGRKIGLAHDVELDNSVRGFHRQMAFMIKSFFFVFIGAMLAPPWSLILLGVLLAMVLFAVRGPAVFVALLGSDFTKDERKLTVVCLPRGMAAGVLATLPMAAGVPDTDGLPIAVFACVLTTIAIFAIGFPLTKRRLAPSEGFGVIPLPAGAARPSAPPGKVTEGGGAASLGQDPSSADPGVPRQ